MNHSITITSTSTSTKRRLAHLSSALVGRLAPLALLLLLPALAQAASAAWTPPDPVKLKDDEIGLLKQELAQTKGQQTKDRVGRLVFETQLQVAALRGFGVEAPVRYAPLTDQVLGRIIDSSLRHDYPGRALEFYVWFNQVFSALPAELDLPRLFKSLMGEQAAGLYDPQSKTLYVREDFALESPLGRMVLAHEICHALQDQNHSFDKMGLDDPADADRSLATLSIAEGDATLLMSEYITRYSSPLSILGDLPQMLSIDQRKFDAAPEMIRQTVLFPYLKGMAFFQTLDGRTRQNPRRRAGVGEARWRDEIFKAPPATTAQILHPEKYLADEKPLKLPALGKGGHDKNSSLTVLGEFGIQVTLAPTLGQERAEHAAAGWRGDELLVTDQPLEGRRTMEWVSRWETSRDASEFALALEDALKAHFGGKLAWQGDKTRRRAQTQGAELEITREGETAVRLKGSFKLTQPAEGKK